MPKKKEVTIKQFYKEHNKKIESFILSALEEDKITNDITSDLLSSNLKNRKIDAALVCKEDCMLAGIDIFKRVIKYIDPNIIIKCIFKDGVRIRKNTTVMLLSGRTYSLLRAERTALNFIQRMSGIATFTDMFVKKLKYRNSYILHTRKTTPNFRLFEILSVKIGGGEFYRENLSSSIMIKDNHIISAGSVREILRLLNKSSENNYTIIEIKNISELNELLDSDYTKINRVMLDNFSEKDIRQAISLLNKIGMEIEISGGIKLKNFIKKQKKAIKYYSIGALTSDYKSIDFSLEFGMNEK